MRVLFICTGNSARSIMAEALLRHRANSRLEVISAGTEPKGVNLLSLQVLGELGVDASAARSKSVQEVVGKPFDYVVTVCDQARQACPTLPGSHELLHWSLEDPAAVKGSEEQRLTAFREMRDEIDRRVTGLVSMTLADQGTGLAGPA
jgi:arsenate reductase